MMVPATDRQRRYVAVLCHQTHSQVPVNLDRMTKAEANRIIGALREKRQEAATVGRVIQKRQNA